MQPAHQFPMHDPRMTMLPRVAEHAATCRIPGTSPFHTLSAPPPLPFPCLHLKYCRTSAAWPAACRGGMDVVQWFRPNPAAGMFLISVQGHAGFTL